MSKEEEYELVNAIQNTFRGEQGRQTLYWLSELTGFTSSGIGATPQETERNIGRREVFVELLTTLNISADKLIDSYIDTEQETYPLDLFSMEEIPNESKTKLGDFE